MTCYRRLSSWPFYKYPWRCPNAVPPDVPDTVLMLSVPLEDPEAVIILLLQLLPALSYCWSSRWPWRCPIAVPLGVVDPAVHREESVVMLFLSLTAVARDVPVRILYVILHLSLTVSCNVPLRTCPRVCSNAASQFVTDLVLMMIL